MFKNVENRNELRLPVEVANKIFPDVVKQIRERKEPFKLSNATPEEIADLIEEFPNQINVETYFTRNKRVLGYFIASKPTTIHLNRASFPRRPQNLVATFYHELTHAVDHFAKNKRFGHGGNKYEPWKEETAPFWIDSIAEKIAIQFLGLNSQPSKPMDRGSWIEYRSWKSLWIKPHYIEWVLNEQNENESPHEYEEQNPCENTQFA